MAYRPLTRPSVVNSIRKCSLNRWENQYKKELQAELGNNARISNRNGRWKIGKRNKVTRNAITINREEIDGDFKPYPADQKSRVAICLLSTEPHRAFWFFGMFAPLRSQRGRWE